MTDLENTSTGLTESVPDDQAATSVASGQYSIPSDISPDKPVFLVNPETNELFSISNPTKAQALLEGGWQPESADSQLKRAIEDKVKETPISAGIVTAASQFSNQFFLGLPQVLNENVGDDETKKKVRGTYEALAKEHPIANIAGGALGMGAMLLATGGAGALSQVGDSALSVAKAAQAVGGTAAVKEATKAIISTGARAGVENVAMNLPYRLTEEFLGDPEVANESIIAHGAEDFAIGFGLGAGTSMIAPVIKAASGIASKVISPEWLSEQANKFKFKHYGALTTEFNKLDDIFPGRSRAEQIQGVIDTVDEHVSGLSQALGSNAIFKKLEKAKAAAGQTLNDLRLAADTAAPDGAISYRSINDALDNVQKEYGKGNLAPAAGMDLQAMADQYGPRPGQWPAAPASGVVTDLARAPDIKAVDFVRNQLKVEAVRKMRSMGLGDAEISQRLASGDVPNFTLAETHQFRQSVKSQLFKEEQSLGIKTDGGTDAWKAIGGVMDNAIGQLATKSGYPQLEGAFSAANKKFSKLKVIIDEIIEPAANRAASRNKIGLTSTISALGGIQPFAAAMMKQFYGNYMMYQALGTAAKVLDNASGDVSKAVDALLNSKIGKDIGVGSVSIWSRYTGQKDVKPFDAFKQVQADISNAQASPDLVAASLSAMSKDLQSYAPQNYMRMTGTTQRAMEYLRQSAPKPPPPLFAGGPVPPWRPSDNELSKYSRRLNAVFSPTSILQELKSGTLTRESVDAVRTVYPNYFGAIQNEVRKRISQAKPGEVYVLRQKLGLLLEDTESPESRSVRISGLQAGFAENNNQVKPRANSKIDEAGRYETPLQRISHD